MYLEVSGRRTGKTTRCIEKACELHFKGLDFYILSINDKNIPYFLLKYFIPITEFNIEKYFTRKDILIIDEFEYIKGKIPYNPIYTKNWFVVGTPFYSQSDNLKTLINLNDGIYIKYINDKVYRQLKEMGDIPLDELKGEFIDN